MYTDFILNGQAHGPVSRGMEDVRWDSGLRRPFLDQRGRRCVTINTGRKVFRKCPRTGAAILVPERKTFPVENLMARGIYSPVFNATSLRKEEWINLDRAVVMAARLRLRAWMDIESSGTVSGFDGMSKLVHQYEAMSDPGEALVDMDGMTPGRTDAPQFKLRSVPLPITHSDFWFSERALAVSRNTGTPLDTSMAEAAGRRVAEMIEQTVIGTVVGVTYGGVSTGPTAIDGTSRVYGMTNFPYRVTKTDLTTPTGSNPEGVMTDVIEMRELMYANGFFGPFVLYTSSGYDAYFDNDYFRSGSTSATRTLRERIRGIDGITDIRRLDFLTSGFQMVLVQMTPDVVQAINAMEITTLQWDEKGGMEKHFKVMCIKVPLFKAPYNGVAAIVHATTS